jgi:hypothetical protein
MLVTSCAAGIKDGCSNTPTLGRVSLTADEPQASRQREHPTADIHAHSMCTSCPAMHAPEQRTHDSPVCIVGRIQHDAEHEDVDRLPDSMKTSMITISIVQQDPLQQAYKNRSRTLRTLSRKRSSPADTHTHVKSTGSAHSAGSARLAASSADRSEDLHRGDKTPHT